MRTQHSEHYGRRADASRTPKPDAPDMSQFPFVLETPKGKLRGKTFADIDRQWRELGNIKLTNTLV